MQQQQNELCCVSDQKRVQAANLCSDVPLFSPRRPPPTTLTRQPPFPCSLAYLQSAAGDSNVNEEDLNVDRGHGLNRHGKHAPAQTHDWYLAAKPRLRRRMEWEIGPSLSLPGGRERGAERRELEHLTASNGGLMKAPLCHRAPTGHRHAEAFCATPPPESSLSAERHSLHTTV